MIHRIEGEVQGVLRYLRYIIRINSPASSWQCVYTVGSWNSNYTFYLRRSDQATVLPDTVQGVVCKQTLVGLQLCPPLRIVARDVFAQDRALQPHALARYVWHWIWIAH